LKRKEKQIAAGKLLIEARKRHPTEKAFEKFLDLAGGIGIRRAQDFIAFAVGRKDFDRHQAENAAAQQRHRDKLKADKIERDKANAALPKPDPKKPEISRITRNASTEELLRQRTAMSASALQDYEDACRTYLPKLNKADLKKARAFVERDEWQPKARKIA
jgi:hypothetical protein